jgi:chromosomal replication initiator protein
MTMMGHSAPGEEGGRTLAHGQWQTVRTTLRDKLGSSAFDFYIKGLLLLSAKDDVVVLAAPTTFIRGYVSNSYLETLRQAWGQVRGRPTTVQVIFDQTVIPAQPSNDDARTTNGSASTTSSSNGSRPVMTNGHATAPVDAESSNWDGGLGLKLDPRYTFDDFIVGKPNEFAYTAARGLAEDNAVEFTQLFIHGGSGVGKTHLMQAIAWEIRRRFPEKRVLYLSSERFITSFIRAIRYKEMIQFKEQLRAADILLIDDVHLLGGKESTQEEFFYTFNALVEGGRKIVLTADRPPVDLDGIEERIKSRLSWGLAVQIDPANFELRLSILQSKAEMFRKRYPLVVVPDKVLEFLAHKVIASVRTLEGGLHRVIAHAALVNRPVTLEFVQEILPDLLRASDRKILIEDIQRKVADYYNIRLTDLLSPRRSRVVARPRQVAMYLAKTLTTRSLPEIGRKFGGRDHTTVIHAVRKIGELRQTDAALNEDISVLQRMIEG